MNSAPPSDDAETSGQIQVLPSQQQQQPPHHYHNAIDDMLNEEAVEEGDQAIECAEEADNKHRSELEASQNVLTNRTNNNADGLGLDHTNTLSSPPSYDQTFGNRLRCHGKIMRHHGNSKVTNSELFFDLVFVYASTLFLVFPFPSFIYQLCCCCCFCPAVFPCIVFVLASAAAAVWWGRVNENEVTGSSELTKVKHE